jgi:hypothetical protein
MTILTTKRERTSMQHTEVQLHSCLQLLLRAHSYGECAWLDNRVLEYVVLTGLQRPAMRAFMTGCSYHGMIQHKPTYIPL